MPKKIKLILGIIILIVLAYHYYSYSYDFAWGICREAVAERYICKTRSYTGECSSFEDETTESNGLYRSWNETKRCVHRLLPFPYGKEAQLSE
jgi:hypothetical protein